MYCYGYAEITAQTPEPSLVNRVFIAIFIPSDIQTISISTACWCCSIIVCCTTVTHICNKNQNGCGIGFKFIRCIEQYQKNYITAGDSNIHSLFEKNLWYQLHAPSPHKNSVSIKEVHLILHCITTSTLYMYVHTNIYKASLMQKYTL